MRTLLSGRNAFGLKALKWWGNFRPDAAKSDGYAGGDE
jgi:hypothetical protein